MSPYETMTTQQLETEYDFMTNLIAKYWRENNQEAATRCEVVLAEIEALLKARGVEFHLK